MRAERIKPHSPWRRSATARKSLKMERSRRPLISGMRNPNASPCMAGATKCWALELMLRTTAGDVNDVNVQIDDLKGPSIIPAANVQLSLELYQFVVDGSWSWGPASQMLPSKKWYPEVLAPFRDPYDSAHKPVGAPFVIKTDNGPNQGVWIDVYVPKDAAPGKYQAPIRVSQGGTVKLAATLELTVHNFTLPDQTHVDGYGEIYGRAYGFHGVSYNQDANKWWQVARRYHQMAHQHRFVITERDGAGPSPEDWNVYDKTYGSLLNGTCFTPEQGYAGPGQGTGVAFWRAPFAQAYDSKVPDFDDEKLKNYTNRARVFWEHCVQNKWENRRFFAYIIDEAGSDARSKIGNQKLQEALDHGAGANHINLMWTSHTDAATFANDPARDLRGVIRWWSPNGGACDPGFLQPARGGRRDRLVLSRRPSERRRAWRERNGCGTAHLGHDLLAIQAQWIVLVGHGSGRCRSPAPAAMLQRRRNTLGERSAFLPRSAAQ